MDSKILPTLAEIQAQGAGHLYRVPSTLPPLSDWEHRWLNRLIERLQRWRNDDHEDTLALSRGEVVMLLEGLERRQVPTT